MRLLVTWAVGAAAGLPWTCLHAHEPARRVEEASYVAIGGLEQWITIRADNESNPVLLLLHGGPADVQSPFASTYAPYEKAFVLVQWDQRGAGRTFAKNGPGGVTLDKQIADGIELSEWLHERFPGRDLVVLGHSWGSIIATGMVQRRPDLFSAYVGTGQVAAWADTVQFQFDFLKERYREEGNAAGLATLEGIGKPDPRNVGQYFGFSRPIRKYMNSSDTAWFADMQQLAIANGETEVSIQGTSEGMRASGAALVGSMVTTDLPATAAAFAVPYYVIQGRHDLSAPTPLAEAYFAGVIAPRKRMVVIEDAGHFALATHQAQVIAALEEMLR
jgi:pimeloyl-ACP methyl ester carboxylesterase